MSATEFAADSLIRHQIFLQRYSNGLVKRMLPFMRSMLKDINAQILAGDVTAFAMGRLIALQRDISQIVSASMLNMGEALTGDLTALGEVESGFATSMLNKMSTSTFTGVTVDQIAATLNNKPMNLVSGQSTKSLTINQAINQFAQSTKTTVNFSIQAGIAEGQTTTQIAKEVRRTITNRTRHQAEALIRTAANHAGSQSRAKVYEENAELLEGEKFNATLDSNTTMVCASNDSKIFPVGEGAQPPLHFNCRSIRVPVVKPEYTLAKLEGERQSRGASGKKTVSGKTTFNSWLHKQPKEFQAEYFGRLKDGEAKMKLFRGGGLHISKFTDSRSIEYSLEQLRSLEPTAFARISV